MASAQPRFLAATAVGIALSSCFVGMGLSLSYIVVPTVLLPASSTSTEGTTSSSKPCTSTPQLARQWRAVYDLGKAAALPIIFGSALSYGYAAFQLPDTLQTQRYLFIASATLSLLIPPYTLTMMQTTNTVLMQRAEAADAMKEIGEDDVTEVGMPTASGLDGQRTEDLLKSWASLNVGRNALPVLSIACAITALVW